MKCPNCGYEHKPLEIRVRYIDPDMPELQQIEGGDWIDLRTAEDKDYKKGDIFTVRLGVAMELPSGFEAHVVPRSSTCRNFGVMLVNSQGIIDNSYKGDNDEWKAEFLAVRDGSMKRHDRILQFRVMEQMPETRFNRVESLGNPDRGGFGTTGTR